MAITIRQGNLVRSLVGNKYTVSRQKEVAPVAKETVEEIDKAAVYEESRKSRTIKSKTKKSKGE